MTWNTKLSSKLTTKHYIWIFWISMTTKLTFVKWESSATQVSVRKIVKLYTKQLQSSHGQSCLLDDQQPLVCLKTSKISSEWCCHLPKWLQTCGPQTTSCILWFMVMFAYLVLCAIYWIKTNEDLWQWDIIYKKWYI